MSNSANSKISASKNKQGLQGVQNFQNIDMDELLSGVVLSITQTTVEKIIEQKGVEETEEIVQKCFDIFNSYTENYIKEKYGPRALAQYKINTQDNPKKEFPEVEVYIREAWHSFFGERIASMQQKLQKLKEENTNS